MMLNKQLIIQLILNGTVFDVGISRDSLEMRKYNDGVYGDD